MEVTTQNFKIRKVFQVAKELQRETPPLISFLEEKGFDVSRKVNSPVNEEMYVELLRKFDKNRYKQYQNQLVSEREEDQKRESVKLREAELEKILAVRKEKPEKKKVDLPSGKLKIIAQPVAEAPIDTDKKLKDATLDKKAKGTKKRVPLKEIKEVAPEVLAEKDKEKAAEPVKEIVRKVELPTPTSLKIVQQAPPKQEKPPRKTQFAKQAVQVPRDAEAAEKPVTTIELTADQKPATAVSDREGEKKRAPKPKRRGAKEAEVPYEDLAIAAKPRKKLKRKKPITKVETAEDALETSVDAKRIREKEKEVRRRSTQDTGKPVFARSAGKRKKRRRKSRRDDADQLVGASPNKNQRPEVSAEEVDAAIRQTMEKMDGRGRGRKKHAKGHSTAEEIIEPATLKLTEYITAQELANQLELSVQDVIRRGLEMGTIISINARLDRDVIELLASEFGAEVEFVLDEELEVEEEEVDSKNVEPRHPVVTVMGHVDHGKTTLLDYLRRSKVAEGEVGGITQHIGAYEINYNGRLITFLDTPGHEAFTAMRARGAQITDIVVLVVAADDRVMPQTVEAIDHARAAGVQIIIAVNKIDKPQADPEAVYQQLSDRNVLVEKWGGKYQCTEISAKFGDGVEDLLAEILVAADLLELKCDTHALARGVVVESRLDKGLGAVSTILVQNGTLKIGDIFVVGQHYGRVRSLYNEIGKKLEKVGPASPAQVVGFHGVPQAGDRMMVYDTEKEAREISQRRQRQHREISMRRIRTISLDQISTRMKENELQELPLIIKGDVHGSVEVLSDSLMKLSTSEVMVQIIHRGVGGVTESDILLAAASGAIVIGFHVSPNMQARELAREQGVEVLIYRIIHEVVDDIRKSLEGLLAPIQEEQIIGTVDIRQTFKISRIGTIAGCHVLDGKIRRNSKVKLLRDDVEMWRGELSSLKRFNDDVREVVMGFECGIALAGYNNINIGDRIEVVEIVETARKLESSV